jgi:predicted RNA-binding Zn-ribbon protein involved in translation (DUF1610 family)
MTTIRTTCPRCGEVDMAPQAILLSIRDELGEGSYRFSCPECRSTIEKPADRKVVALLLSAGVELADPATGRRAASGEPHPESRPEGPPFTLDDVIAFHFLLSDDRRVAEALLRAQGA